jgi:hypothetical protein
MESMSLKSPPGVFISITIAAAFWPWAVETTLDMNAAEPGSTATSKFAMTTTFPLFDASDWTDAADAGTKKQPNTNSKSAAQTRTHIDARKTFLLSLNNFLLFFDIWHATYKVWLE